MVTLGIALFLVGVNVGLIPIGNAIGSDIPRSGSIVIILMTTFFFRVFSNNS